MNPKNCKNINNERYDSIDCPNAKNNWLLINKIYSSINYAQDDDNSKPNTIKNQAISIRTSYRDFLDASTTALYGYTEKFRPIKVLYDHVVGDQSILGFINCAFIGKNIKVVLNYLNETLGNNFMTFGLVFVINGFILLFQIAFTILFLSTINEIDRIGSINEHKDKISNYVNK